MADSERNSPPKETPAQKDTESAEVSPSDNEAAKEFGESGQAERQSSITCIFSTPDSAAVQNPPQTALTKNVR